jgi:molecular chaperone GrpE
VSAPGNGQDKDIERTGGSAATEEPASDTGLEPAAEPAADAPAPTDELGALRRERSELRDELLRRRADFDNYRKRVERDRGAATADAEAALLRLLLGTLDNLERALAAQDSGTALREGVVLTHRELVALFDSLGVTAIDPLGERFDPAAHQAILHEPAPGFAGGTVAEVFRKGYRYRDRLLRPALVKVASGTPESDADDGGDVH